MTLQEAISHALERATQDCSECAKEHEQLANWLIELRDIKMNKPMIRHCYNCKYYSSYILNYNCTVKYIDISSPRLRAMTCRFYKQKEVADDGKS